MRGGESESIQGQHVVIFNWRDTANPEGGGSERYVEKMARGLAERGARVTVFCAAHAEAPDDEVVDGVRFMRRGSRLDIYPRAVWHLLRRRFGPVDLVIDVQNGLPFFTRLATRKPVVVLVHHVHREVWPVIFPGRLAALGWWIESRLAPRLYRRSQYIAVSQATRGELVEIGVDGDRIAVVHNGTEPAPLVDERRTPYPSLCVVGRLVPHKQVEHVVDAVVALRDEHPDLRVTVAGAGWWDEDLRKYAAERGVLDMVEFEGHVSEHRKHEIFARSWVHVLPSLKEGWGLVIGEAGSHGVPTIAYESAGGTRESIHHDHSGLLVADQAELTATVHRLLTDVDELDRLGRGALAFSHTFAWEHSQESFARVAGIALGGGRVDVEDPAGP